MELTESDTSTVFKALQNTKVTILHTALQFRVNQSVYYSTAIDNVSGLLSVLKTVVTGIYHSVARQSAHCCKGNAPSQWSRTNFGSWRLTFTVMT